jgi:outer membrane cobalamin receptor
MFRVIGALVLGVGLSAGSVWAQATVNIGGTVKDVSGGVLSGATVNAVVAGRTVSTATTGEAGRYQVQAPSGAPVVLQITLQGFADQAVELPGATSSVSRDVTLQVGGVSDRLVVTASRAVESRASVTSAITVMAAPEIQTLGVTSLAELVKFVPGLNSEGTGREGALTSLFSRGGESDYNLVLIDGVRVNQSGGAFDFSRIAASEIDRVEIVRGAQSSLWGSDAMGAVVQVFTHRANATSAPRVSGNIEAGSFNTVRTDARVTGGAGGRADYHAGMAFRRSDGAFESLLREKDTFEQTAFDGSVGVALGSRATIRTGLRYSNGDGRSVGNFVYGISDSGTEDFTKDLSWHLNVSHVLGSRYTGTGTINYFRSDFESNDRVLDPTVSVYALLEGRPGAIFPDSPRLVRLLTQPEFANLSANPGGLGANQFVASTPFGASDFAPSLFESQFRRPAFRYHGDIAWMTGQRTTVGYEFERESSPLNDLHQLDNNAVLVQHQINVGDRWFVTAGARLDDKSDYDSFFSPKLSIGGYPVALRRGALSSMKVFFNIGKGIKTPTFAERFGGSFADGNPDLKVERARSTDVGVEATFADQRLRGAATYFHNQFRDQVEFRSTNAFFSLDGLPDYTNVAGSRATGVELELMLQRPISGVWVAGNYALVDTEVQETISTGVQFQPGQPLFRRPKHSGTLRAWYEIGMATVNMHARFVGQRHDSAFLGLRAVPNGTTVPSAVSTDITVNPGYTVVGLGLDVRAHDVLTVFVRGDNIADTEYESAVGWPGLPRSFVVGARVNVTPR